FHARHVVHDGDIVQLCLWQAYSVDPHRWRLRATAHSHTIAAVAAQRERDPRHRAEKLAHVLSFDGSDHVPREKLSESVRALSIIEPLEQSTRRGFAVDDFHFR